MVSSISQTSILLLLLFYASTSQKGIVRDPYNKLVTWSSEKDCCAWKGVQCDNTTSRVTKLDLSTQSLEGEMNLALLELEFLNHLDLSMNNFNAISIPSIPNDVISDSNLQYLDLSLSGYNLSMDNLNWLSQLSSLKQLDLRGTDLHKETNWLLAMPPSLSNLYLRDCQLTSISPSANLTSLVTVDLSYNNFNSELPCWLFNLSNDISHLDLSWSSLHGEIPLSLFNHQNLEYLDLSHNMFSGSIPSSLGNLTSLTFLDIGSNSFSGTISETHFSRLRNLEYLHLSNSSFAFHFNPEWVPLFQLKVLDLDNTNQGAKLPSWIYTQKSLEYLDISSSGITFVDEDRFKRLIAGNYFMLDMSNNSINEDISNVMLNSSFIKLRHNNFSGRLPQLSNVQYVDLSHNSFTGSIPPGWQNLNYLFYINLWSNKLFGEVPVELSNLTRLEVMNLGKNEFYGTIPINMPQNLQVVILRYNHFEGSIPPQLFNLSFLAHLDLAHNKLSGSIPQVTYNITQMVRSEFSHSFVDDDLINLFTKGQDYEYNLKWPRATVDLSANNLTGEIPLELFGLIQVQTLNLSYNHLIGTIPKTIGGMKNLESLDLSNNKLFGEIPQTMTTLSFLSYLNMSCNNFTGQIPVGTQLQSFDASSYIGNPELCGAPLPKCNTEDNNHGNATENTDGDSEKESLYLGMGVGFAVGFWGFCGSLLLLRKWRHKYYRFFDRLADQLYVTYMVKFNIFVNREAPVS
ncbi:Receptor-like protein EIX2 [Glycine soja]|uniref:Receptor-like protein EIX2 n=1 Tax=Glycine soja TaxID=3848 RepID=A0A445FF39_GLYSO|nr:Receptor-like protein EIX2 [Glycine soja]